MAVKVTICYQCLSYRFFPGPSSPGRRKKAAMFGKIPWDSTESVPEGENSVPHSGRKLVTES